MPGPPPPSADASPPGAQAPAPAPAPAPAEPGGGAGPTEQPAEAPKPQQVGAGAEASAATSRTGEGSRRAQNILEAERRFIAGDSFGGDAVGRDKNIYHIGHQRDSQPGQLSSRHEEPLQEAFVPPREFDEARSKFEKERIVILRGPAGCGKRGLGIRLLVDYCSARYLLSSVSEISHLDSWISSRRAGRLPVGPGTGFLLERPGDFAALTSTALLGLDEMLTSADARLAVIVDASIPISDADLTQYIVDIDKDKDFAAIATSHLKYQLRIDSLDQLTSREEIQEIIASQLDGEPSCQKAANLAEAIAKAMDKEDGEYQFHRERLKAGTALDRKPSFDTWFDGLDDTRSRCFAVALAVLDGMPYDVVAKAARALQRRLDKPPPVAATAKQEPPPAPETPFTWSNDRWQARLQASVKLVEVRGSYGSSFAETVEYKNSDLPKFVLRRAWSDYEVQPSLIEWLDELARDDIEMVRVYAGLTIGFLAASSFDYLSINVLRPWAFSERNYQHEAVANALRLVAARPELLAPALAIISNWYKDTDHPMAQATAARAYGLAYGPIDQNAAFSALFRLSKVDDIRVVIAVGDSIADLLEGGDDSFVQSAVCKLADSVTDLKHGPAIQLIFLIIANALVTKVGPETPAAGAVEWPFLLRQVHRLAGVRDAVITLWRYALNGTSFGDLAEGVITGWAATAESQPEARDAFLRMARSIAHGDDRLRRVLDRCAAKWVSADDFSGLPTVGEALRTVLSAEKGA